MWIDDQIYLSASDRVVQYAKLIYERTCRTDFDFPGFCLISIDRKMDSKEFRESMVELKQGLSEIYESRMGGELAYLSAMRFDQQTTTKLHLDGGPAESLLMLGYEPTEVESELVIADYAKCAFDLGLTPHEFLEKHNPMFEAGEELLRPYSTKLSRFSNSQYQIVVINNSSAEFSESVPRWQGTLHTAKILMPDASKARVINSTMIAPHCEERGDKVSETELEDFVSSGLVRKRRDDGSVYEIEHASV